MTREQAQEIILAALGDVGPNGFATASHIATALDALGLLAFAAAAHRVSAATRTRFADNALTPGQVAAEALQLIADRDRVIARSSERYTHHFICGPGNFGATFPQKGDD